MPVVWYSDPQEHKHFFGIIKILKSSQSFIEILFHLDNWFRRGLLYAPHFFYYHRWCYYQYYKDANPNDQICSLFRCKNKHLQVLDDCQYYHITNFCQNWKLIKSWQVFCILLKAIYGFLLFFLKRLTGNCRDM